MAGVTLPNSSQQYFRRVFVRRGIGIVLVSGRKDGLGIAFRNPFAGRTALVTLGNLT
jgi:hypothetical protein